MSSKKEDLHIQLQDSVRKLEYMINDQVYESGCFDGNRDHLATLEDVEEFLKAEYEEAGLTW